jgi:hypothetical protein
MSDQSATPERGGEQPAEPAQQTTPEIPAEPPAWLGPIEQRMAELRDQNVEMAERLSALTAEPEQDEDEFLPEDEWYDEDGELTPEAAQQIVDQRVREAVGQILSERDASEALDMRELAFDELRERIPALQEDAYATQLVRDVADDLTEAGLAAAIETPVFVDLIEREHKARQFDERMTAEDEPQQRVVLEAAGGSSRAQQSKQETDWGERIQKAAERLKPQI